MIRCTLNDKPSAESHSDILYRIRYDDLVLVLIPLEIHQGFGDSYRGREG